MQSSTTSRSITGKAWRRRIAQANALSQLQLCGQPPGPQESADTALTAGGADKHRLSLGAPDGRRPIVQRRRGAGPGRHVRHLCGYLHHQVAERFANPPAHNNQARFATRAPLGLQRCTRDGSLDRAGQPGSPTGRSQSSAPGGRRETPPRSFISMRTSPISLPLTPHSAIWPGRKTFRRRCWPPSAWSTGRATPDGRGGLAGMVDARPAAGGVGQCGSHFGRQHAWRRRSSSAGARPASTCAGSRMILLMSSRRGRLGEPVTPPDLSRPWIRKTAPRLEVVLF